MACVYFIVNKSWTDCIKIGKSKNLSRRLKQHNRGGCSYPHYWEVVRVISCANGEHSDLEKLVHRYFKKYRNNKKEFFEISLEQVDEFLKENIVNNPAYQIHNSLEGYLYGDLSSVHAQKSTESPQNLTKAGPIRGNKRGRPHGTKGAKSRLTDEQVLRLYDSCTGRNKLRNAALITFGLHFGMKQNDVADLTIEQVLDENNKCRDKILVKSSSLKTSKAVDRYFTSQEGRKIVEEYVSTLSDKKSYLANRDNPLFPAKNTRQFVPEKKGSILGTQISVPCSSNVMCRMVVNQFKKAGIDGESWESSRKTFAFKMTESGMGLEQTAEIMQINNSSTLRDLLEESLGLNNNVLIARTVEELTYQGKEEPPTITAPPHIDITKMRKKNKVIIFS
jgi:integrase